jgi:DNA cross-link repair 1C protein
MPPGTPYKSFVLPYSIRVDEFTDLPEDYPVVPTLHLLTHTHTDHLVGLSSKSFGYVVICSPDAKEMLLRHEVYANRHLYAEGLANEKKRTFAHLQVGGMRPVEGRGYQVGRDLLVSSCVMLFACR